jgi:hypothetical protein
MKSSDSETNVIVRSAAAVSQYFRSRTSLHVIPILFALVFIYMIDESKKEYAPNHLEVSRISAAAVASPGYTHRIPLANINNGVLVLSITRMILNR